MRASLPPRYCRRPWANARRHAPGTFSWADLSTTDTDGAKAFYTGLFGWDTEDTPIPEGGVYTMLLEGREERRGPVRRSGRASRPPGTRT